MTTVVFDLGGVLIDWNPRYLYRQLLAGDDEVERFVTEIVTQDWNVEQDRGRTWAEAVAKLSAEHPEYAELIAAYDTRWAEMIAGQIDGTVEILTELRDAGVELYALTNWSAEKFPVARERFEWLGWFDGIVVSGEERLIKPDPRIFQVLFDRHGVRPSSSVYIDDNETNVRTAAELGMTSLRFRDPAQLRADLEAAGVLPTTP